MKDTTEQLKLLNNENIIWIIYIFISIFAIVSNHFEKQYDLTNDKESYIKYKIINICIFTIAFFIYLYFFILIYNKSKKVRQSLKKYCLTKTQLLGAILFLIGGIIYLIVEIFDQDDINISII